ncbi:MAG: hypothetical protein ACI4XM_00800 [Candidatus Coprovivens sp.]
MKKLLFIYVIFVLCGCSNNQKVDSNYLGDEQIEKEISKNLNMILEVSDVTSSNPFDYTNNEYYNNIVSLGKDAVSVLESMYKNGELLGINAYLSALAIEDITDCNLYEKYGLDWSTASEFYNLWKDNNCSFYE